MSGNKGGGNRNTQTLAARRRQSQRDKMLGQMIANSGLASIPKGPSMKKEQMFRQGALKSFQFAPRGHGYYDAFANKPDTATVSVTTGPATVIMGHSSDTIPGIAMQNGLYQPHGEASLENPPANHTGNATLVLFNPSASDSQVACQYSLSIATGLLTVVKTELRVAQFSELGPVITNASTGAQHADAQPNVNNLKASRRVESIPLRGSARFRNITEKLAVGGLLRVLRYNGGLQLNIDTTGSYNDPASGDATVAHFLEVCNMVRDSTRTRTFSGHELEVTHQSNCYPADFVRSMAFEKDRSFYEAVAAPPYCTIVYLIDDYAASSSQVNNTYEFNFQVQRAARFGPGTILHGMSRALQVQQRPSGEDEPPAKPSDGRHIKQIQ